MSIDRWMDKEIVVYIHNGILLSHKKESLWVSSKEVDVARIYYTEWSQKEKDKYHILTHIYNGIFVSHKKEQMWISWTDIDETWVCYTEWSKSEGEKQIYANSYIWNLEKWYWWTSLQGRNRDADT